MAASPGAVDVQQHFVPPAMLEVLEEHRPGVADFLRPRATDLAPLIEEMDEGGIEIGLLSLPELGQYRADRRDADSELARRYNDELLEAASADKSRFRVSMTLPFPHPDACIAEFDRLKDEPLVKGVIAFCATEHYTLDDPALDQVYDAIAKAGMPMFLHPAFGQLTTLEIFSEWKLSNSIAPLIETSSTAAKMMLSGVLDRVPDLILVIPHLGGLLPYIGQRVIDNTGMGDAEQDVLHYLRNNCLLDSCSFHHPALDCAVATVSADRILLASDYPFRGPIPRAADDIQSSDLGEAEKAAIMRGNAERLGLAD